MSQCTISKLDKVAIITIDRPPANALSMSLIVELTNIFSELEQDETIRVVLIHGNGRFFSAGADIKEFTTIETEGDFSKLARKGQQAFEKIEKFPKPVIAAIHGAALGGGLELAMACHIRLVSDDAKLGLPELQLGLIPGFAGTMRLPLLIGTAKAAELLMTSDTLTGKEAVKWGLANSSYPEAELLDRAKDLAHKIAKKSPVVLKATIAQLQFSKTDQFYKGIEEEAQHFGKLSVSEAAKEGIQAFIEKREPKF